MESVATEKSSTVHLGYDWFAENVEHTIVCVHFIKLLFERSIRVDNE